MVDESYIHIVGRQMYEAIPSIDRTCNTWLHFRPVVEPIALRSGTGQGNRRAIDKIHDLCAPWNNVGGLLVTEVRERMNQSLDEQPFLSF